MDGRRKYSNPRCACAPRVNNTMHFKTCADQRGISIDADVALWLDKLEVDGRPQLPTITPIPKFCAPDERTAQ